MPPAPALISRFYTETISSSDELDRQYKNQKTKKSDDYFITQLCHPSKDGQTDRIFKTVKLLPFHCLDDITLY